MSLLVARRDADGLAPPRLSNAVERAARPDLRVLRQLAGRLEASVQGSVKQNLVRQLIETLADLSRTLQGHSETSRGLVESGAVASDFSSNGVSGASKSPRWMKLLAQLAVSGARSSPMIAVVDRDPDFRSAICLALEAEGLTVAAFANCDLFLRAQTSGGPACLIIDSNLPGMSGLKLLRTLSDQGHALPVIVVAGPSEVQTAVDALKAGVVDFLEKPICCDVLLASVERALIRGRESEQFNLDHEAAADRLLELTPRQRQVMDLILAGHPSKNIAVDIGVSQRTVESHRAEVMRKTGARSMPALARLALAAIGTRAPLSFDFGPTEGRHTPI
jgi:FixJ family two-component response regulator